MMHEIDLEWLKKNLPQLIRENDEIKGAIITALSGVMPTKEDFDKQFEKWNKRFEKNDEKFIDLQNEMRKGFERVDQRFEKMDKRFEKMDKRFEKMDKRFEKMDKRFKKMDEKFFEMLKSIKGLKVEISRIESKSGKNLEILIRELISETLKMDNIDPDKVQTIYLKDEEGQVFHKGYTTDIDVLLKNGDLYLIEIKSTVNGQDIAHFLQIAKLYEILKEKTPTQLIIAALRIRSKTIKMAESQGIKVIWGELSEF